MKKSGLSPLIALLLGSAVCADDLSGSKEFLCTVSRAMLCFENGECFPVQPWEIDMPQFVIVDTGKKRISTPRGSENPRTTELDVVLRENGSIVLQGVDIGRAFSIVIDESTGLLSAAIARDGFSVSAFGACTDADVRPAS